MHHRRPPHWRGDTVADKLKNVLMNGPLSLVSVIAVYVALLLAGEWLRSLFVR